MSAAEDELAMQLRAARIVPVREYRFAPPRRWRFDFVVCLPSKVAVEVEGGVWGKSRHTTGKGYTDDCEKYSEAAALGWRVIRVTTDQAKSGYALDVIERAIGRKKCG